MGESNEEGGRTVGCRRDMDPEEVPLYKKS